MSYHKYITTKLLLIVALLLIGANMTWAEEVTFDVGTSTYYHVKNNEGATMQGITITVADPVNDHNAWTNSYAGIQIGGSVTISPENATITKIVFHSSSSYVKDWSSNIAGQITTIDDNKKGIYTATWTGATTSAITLTNIGTGQAHIKSITVTYTPFSSRHIDATLNAYGYATFSCEYETKVPDGVTAYTGVVNEELKTITWTAIADGIIPAREGVLLRGATSASVSLDESNTSKSNIAGNQLIANLTQSSKAELGNFIYVLSGENIMRLSDTGSLKANRAYFSLTQHITAANGNASMRIVWDDNNTTAIDAIHCTQADKATTYYNINGQRISAKYVNSLHLSEGQGGAGIIIVNGKKTLLR